METRTIDKSIHINAPVSKVWRSITDTALMQQWMNDDEINIFSTWQTGSPILFKGHLHGLPFENKGTIVQFEPESIFQYTFWSSLSQHADIPENYALITFRLTPENGNCTLLTFTQTNFITEVQYQHFNFYWQVALELIKKLNEQ